MSIINTDPCTINFDKTIYHPLTGSDGTENLTTQHILEWVNIVLLFIFTPAFLFVAWQGYKINKEITFEVVVMLIAVLYNTGIGVATFLYCDDFMIMSCQVTSSSIMLYMFYRF